MASFWGRLFGTEKALTGIVDAARDGLDKLVYTDEEKAGDAAKNRTEAREMVVKWMAATQGQNLARRLIALSIAAVWLGMYTISVLCSAIAIFTNEAGVVTSEKIRIVGTIAMSGATEMNSHVWLILAFYFAAPHMGEVAQVITGRISKNITKG